MPFFEVVASLCLGTLCAEHVLPTPNVLDAENCAARRDTVAAQWIERHPDYALKDVSCQPFDDLVRQAAKVEEFSPGAFVHFGHVTELGHHGVADIANTGFIIGEDGVAVIDAGTTRRVGEELYLAIRKQTQLPIKWLILTHMHPDHVLGAEVFHEAGATVIGASTMPRSLGARVPGYMESMKRQLGEDHVHGTAAILPTETVEKSRILDIGGHKLELRAYPTAHTDNDMVVFDHVNSWLWAGDLVFKEHVPTFDGSLLGWIAVLEDLSGETVDRVIPGHGTRLATLPEAIGPIMEYLTTMRDDARKEIANGDRLSEAIYTIGKSQEDKWSEFESFNRRNATVAYKELEWE